MRILIFGGSGMLGHKLWQIFSQHHDTFVTLRSPLATYKHLGIFQESKTLEYVDVFQMDSVVDTFHAVKPEVVINCIGIIKQRPEAKDPIPSLLINSLFPHRLVKLCSVAGARLLHISTDCVFSGKRGEYKEDDAADATDLYGRTKLLGEVNASECLTVRTSIIGRELRSGYGLLEWFLASRGTVKGYVNAIFSGFTTLALARILRQIVEEHPRLCGLYHVSSSPISKYDLLSMIRSSLDMQIGIEPFENYHCNRSLDSTRFRERTGIVPPSWGKMIDDLADDNIQYQLWRDK